MLEGGSAGSFPGAPNDRDISDMWLLNLNTWNWTKVDYIGSIIPRPADGSALAVAADKDSVFRFAGYTCTVM